MANEDQKKLVPVVRNSIDIPFVTFAKVFAAAILTYVAIKLWPLFLLVLLAILLAVTLNPIVEFFERRRLPRWAGILIVAAGMIAIIILGTVFLVPPIVGQLGTVTKSFPELKTKALEHLPTQFGVREMAEKWVRFPANPEESLKKLMSVGSLALDSLTQCFLLLIVAIYFLLDGKRCYDWLLPYFSEENREKLDRTKDEVSEVIFAYVAGQAITSLLAAIFAFGVLAAFRVPGALVLAIFAGVFDVLPILGFFLFTVPAFLLSLTVSPTTALAVLGLYLIYHGIENYFIVPNVYGKRLRVSSLVILLGLLAASILAGIPGAIAILPILASYPIVERIWLSKYVGREVVSEHRPKRKK